MQKIAITAFGLFVCMLLSCGELWAENWPGWRGPRGDGTSLETGVPIRWSDTENIAWRVDVPCAGHASPIVWEDRVFLVGTDLEHHDRVVTAYDRKTGKLLWERSVVRSPLEGKHRLNSYASSTPATDGKLVYVSFLEKKEPPEKNQMLVAACDFDGNERWKVRPGVFSSVHGYCSSPVVFEDTVIVNGDHDGESYIVALNRTTGETVWKIPRENRTRSYCTPIIRDIGGRTQMLLSGSKCVASYDPRNGALHWTIDGPTEQFVASLLYTHDLVFVTAGFPELHVLTIKPTGRGKITDSDIAWHHTGKIASYVPSPIAVGDYIFVASDFGVATCFDARDGTIYWSKNLSRHYSASLVTAGGLAYFLDDNGVMQVIRPGKEFDAVAVNRLFAAAEGEEPPDSCSASPAISQGQIFIRTGKALYCIGKGAQVAGRK
ncbi:MAG: PQQ-binding-like beta-propeller repeat protein [Deltaproteobacteria bacterium]